MTVHGIGRKNVAHLQSLMDGQFDAVALTEYESFEQLVFSPVMDMPVPRLVVIAQTGLPHIICQSIGYEMMIEETYLPPENVHEYHPYDVSVADDYTTSFISAVEEVLSDIDPGTVGIDFEHTSMADGTLLKDVVSGAVGDCSTLLQSVFQARSAEEVELIRDAASVAERGVEAVLDAVEPGMTEYDLAAVAEREMTAAGARARPYDLHCTSGQHTLDPVRRLSHKPVEASESLVVDFLPKVNHYFADIARSVVVGTEPTDSQRELQTVVVAALEYIEDRLRPGLQADEVDAMLREFFAKRGFDGQCITHTGHAVGNDWGPRITSANSTELSAGMVLAIEPGLYVEGIGGVRIEDDFLLTGDGAESLMTLPRDPMQL